MAKRKPTLPDHLLGRIEAVRSRLGADKSASTADALLVTNPVDIRYLTGFIGDDSWALIHLKGDQRRARHVYLLSDDRFREQIGREAPHARPIMRKKSLADELAAMLDKLRLGRVAIQDAHVSVAGRKKLAKAIGGASRLVDTDDGLVQQRAVKTRAEVKAIRKALGIQQQAFRETVETMRPGETEVEVAAYLEYRMRGLGADGTSFPSIVAVDANAALPHAIPGPAKIKRRSHVLIDWGAKADGYCSDLTRVVFLGKPTRQMREVYQLVRAAQLAAIDAIAPGQSLRGVDAVARKIIKKAGHGKHFGHGLGHGIGLDIHEQPVLSYRAPEDGVLEPGHVVTVEPGVYLPGVGGVRIEDDVLVTARGHEVLSDLPTDIESAII